MCMQTGEVNETGERGEERRVLFCFSFVKFAIAIRSISTHFFLTVKCGIDQQSPVGEQRSITRQRRPAIRRRRAFRGSVRRWRRHKQEGRRWSSLLLLLLLPAGDLGPSLMGKSPGRWLKALLFGKKSRSHAKGRGASVCILLLQRHS
ncbi:hypothetical protein B296_00003291 [Ensete ventricosum]|uniref:Uncharacterized protein n=1 Tax=Ensete ventricosum TaxID=4639 RepID=A0A427BAJ7_ENSVE|nr:hypothetical protein B296_00003291 [Ensete ventricosum]